MKYAAWLGGCWALLGCGADVEPKPAAAPTELSSPAEVRAALVELELPRSVRDREEAYATRCSGCGLSVKAYLLPPSVSTGVAEDALLAELPGPWQRAGKVRRAEAALTLSQWGLGGLLPQLELTLAPQDENHSVYEQAWESEPVRGACDAERVLLVTFPKARKIVSIQAASVSDC